MDTVIDDDLYITGDDINIQGTVMGDVVAFGGMVEITGHVDGNVFAFASNVNIRGTVLGDVMATGGQIEISGNVTGDVAAGGGNVIINGNVDDDVRVGSGMLTVNGHVGDDLVAGTGNLLISDEADIGRDLIFGSGQVDLRGDVAGNLTGEADVVTLAGSVGGDADLKVEILNALPTSRINGSLTYTSPEETIISGTVGNNIHFIKKVHEKEIGSSVIWWLVRYLFLLVIGLLAIALLPNRTAAFSRAVPNAPLRNLAMGFLLVVAGLAGSLLLFVTVIGIPLGIILLFVTIVFVYTARLHFGLWLGNLIFSRLGKQSKPWMEMVLGLFVLFIFTSLPWVGFWIYLLVTFIAIGGVFKEQKRFYTEQREKGLL